MVDGYNKEIEAIQKEIDIIQEQIDIYEEEIEKLEEQKEPYQDKIDLLNKEKDAIQEKIDIIQEEYLDVMQEEIDALEEQKEPYQDKIDALEKEKEAIQKLIDEIQKEIDKYDEEIEKLEEQKEPYNDKIKKLERQKDAIEKLIRPYQEHIEQLQEENELIDEQLSMIEKRYDEAIKKIEKYKKSWEDLAKEQAKAARTQLLLSFGISPEALTNLDAKTFENFKTWYESVLSSIENYKGSAHFAGTGESGLTHSEKNALRSEFGQPELTVYPNGTYELTTSPTISDLPKGTRILNETETRKALKNKGKAYYDGTGTRYVSLESVDPSKFQMLNAFASLSNAVINIDNNLDKLVRKVDSSRVFDTKNATQNINISIGDINLEKVNDVNSLSQAIVSQLPNQLLQEIHRR